MKSCLYSLWLYLYCLVVFVNICSVPASNGQAKSDGPRHLRGWSAPVQGRQQPKLDSQGNIQIINFNSAEKYKFGANFIFLLHANFILMTNFTFWIECSKIKFHLICFRCPCGQIPCSSGQEIRNMTSWNPSTENPHQFECQNLRK